MKMIWVTFQRTGFHQFNGAHEISVIGEPGMDVRYLANRHRHLFKFKVSIQVFHDDREIEFHQFLNYLEGSIDSGAMELDNKSCEMISDDLFNLINSKYTSRPRMVVIEVSEDGECGSRGFYTTGKKEDDSCLSF